MSTLINKNAARRVQYKIDANKTEIMFPNLECLSAALLREILPSGSTPAGDSAYITDASNLVPVESLKVNIQPMQAGTGDPSPENIRPISGWTDVVVTRTGKNLLNPASVLSGFVNTGSHTIDVNANARTVYIPCKPNTAYTVSKKAGARFVVGETTVTPLVGVATSNETANNTATSITITTTATAKYLVAFVYLSTADTEISADEMLSTVQIETGSTATAYEPYQGQDYTIPLGRTVYGGTLDVTTGELVVSKGYIASYNGETLPSTWMSDRDVYSAGETPTTGAQVVYELAEPQTYTLTPQQVTLIKGINNVFADAGTVEVKYSADIQLYIDKKIAETQALILEN